MILFRLSKANYARDLTGKGAELSGGRWNSKGTPCIYTSESRALCTAEIAVHLPLGNIPVGYQLVMLEVSDTTKIAEQDLKTLPADWKLFPHPHSTQLIGDAFISKNEFLLMKVPSVIVPGEFNFLINPRHKDIHRVKIKSVEAFDFDERLFVKIKAK